MATDGFLKINLTGVVGLLYQTVTPSLMIRASKDAIFIIHNRCHSFAGRVVIGDSLRFHYGLCFFGHLGQQNRQNLFDFLFLFFGQRSPCIAFDTATTATSLQVTAELFLKYV